MSDITGQWAVGSRQSAGEGAGDTFPCHPEPQEWSQGRGAWRRRTWGMGGTRHLPRPGPSPPWFAFLRPFLRLRMTSPADCLLPTANYLMVGARSIAPAAMQDAMNLLQEHVPRDRLP